MIPLVLVTGFLGSGKTTLLRHLVRRHRARKIVWLVNEFSARDVDAAVLGREAEDVVSIAGGSIFCRCLVTEFISLLSELPARFGSVAAPLEAVVVEASGMANPAAAGQMLREAKLDSIYRLAAVIAVADPGTFLKLLHTLPNIRAQIAAASLVLLNKTDLHPPALIGQTEAAIREINPTVEIVPTRYCEAEVELVGPPLDIVVQGPLDACRDPNFVGFTVPVPRELDLQRLRDAVDGARDDIFRIKGFARAAGGGVLLDYSSSGWRIDEAAVSGTPELAVIVRGPCSDAARLFVESVRDGRCNR